MANSRSSSRRPWDEGLGRPGGIAAIIRIVKAVGGEHADEALALLRAELSVQKKHCGRREGAGRRSGGASGSEKPG